MKQAQGLLGNALGCLSLALFLLAALAVPTQQARAEGCQTCMVAGDCPEGYSCFGGCCIQSLTCEVGCSCGNGFPPACAGSCGHTETCTPCSCFYNPGSMTCYCDLPPGG
jgi:hypothetical protein